MDEILHKVGEVIHELFDEFDGSITRDLTAASVPQWDSLGHVQLMVMIEQLFAIRFKRDEISGFANVGELVDAVAMKTARP